MTFDLFDKFQGKLLEECVVMRDTKGKEYAHSEDRFANFNRLAEGLGLTPVQVGWVYTKKHIDAIESFAKNGREFSTEKIRGRIVDAIVYLTLIAGMIEESKAAVTPTMIVASNMDGIRCRQCEILFIASDRVVTYREQKFHYHCMSSID